MIKTKRLRKFDRNWEYHPCIDDLYWVSKHRINDATIDIFIDYCVMWCNRKFGKQRSISIPTVEWEWNDRELQTTGLLGFYDAQDNAMMVRIQGHRTFYNLAKTIIHEYVHYLQPVQGSWYERYYKTHGYDDHPYEIEAYYISQLYSVECTQWTIHEMSPSEKKLR